MELREAFIEGENEPLREAEVFGEVEIAGDGGFNLGTDALFDHAANPNNASGDISRHTKYR